MCLEVGFLREGGPIDFKSKSVEVSKTAYIDLHIDLKVASQETW